MALGRNFRVGRYHIVDDIKRMTTWMALAKVVLVVAVVIAMAVVLMEYK